MASRSAQSVRADADQAATQAANDAAENANVSARDAQNRSEEALDNSRQAAEAASQRTSTTHGAVETRPTSDTFTTLDGSTVTASTDQTVYVVDEGRVVRYDPSDGDADTNGWVPLGRWNAVLDAPEGTVLRGDMERRHSEGPSDWTPWEPSSQPAYDGSGSEPDITSVSYSNWISQAWDTLRQDYADVSRSVLTQGANGNDLYLYDFEPPSWERKAIIFCTQHGAEKMSSLSAYRTIKEAYDSYYSDPQLA